LVPGDEQFEPLSEQAVTKPPSAPTPNLSDRAEVLDVLRVIAIAMILEVNISTLGGPGRRSVLIDTV
jgi:uncharacterized membrane protein YeiB